MKNKTMVGFLALFFVLGFSTIASAKTKNVTIIFNPENLQCAVADEDGVMVPINPTNTANPIINPLATLTPESILNNFKSNYSSTIRTNADYIGHSGIESITEEAVQHLGQIIVDRATAEALKIVQVRLKKMLKCELNTDFSKTCDVVDNLKIQDIAQSPNVLYGALIQDLFDQNKIWLKNIIDGQNAFYLTMIQNIIVAILSQPDLTDSEALSSFITQELIQNIISDSNFLTGNNNYQKAIKVAITAYMQSQIDMAARSSSYKNGYPIYDIVDQLNKSLGDGQLQRNNKADYEMLLAAKQIAADLYQAVSMKKQTGMPDSKARMQKALSAFFKTLELSTTNNPNKDEIKNKIQIMKEFTLAFTNNDSNAMIVSAIKILSYEFEEWLKTCTRGDDDTCGDIVLDKNRDYRRALQLMTGLLQYAVTYTGDDPYSDEAKKLRMQKLENLTSRMTDRSDRAGENVWSLGGSLRGLAGVRLQAEKEPVFYGPISLPMGVAMHYYGKKKGVSGFYLDFGIIDIGQYVSYQENGEVAEPDLEDSLAPSLSIGGFYGTDVPLIYGLTASYSPHYVFEDDFNEEEDRRDGSWNVGAFIGFYVPFIDFN